MPLTRRRLFAQSGLGLATAGLLALTPRLFGSTHRTATAARSLGTSRSGSSLPLAGVAAAAVSPASTGAPTVAYVRDAKRGEVVLLLGTRQVVRTDPALVAALTSAFHDA